MSSELKTIDRDANGFATEECKEQMFNALPIVIVRTFRGKYILSDDLIIKENWYDWVGDIERRTDYTHYFKYYIK